MQFFKRAFLCLLLSISFSDHSLSAEEFAEFEQAICTSFELSPVGSAMFTKLPGSRVAECSYFPDKWLHVIDTDPSGGDIFGSFGVSVRNEFLNTRYNFSHSSLYMHESYEFPRLILELHKKIVGDPSRSKYKPVLRFIFGHSSDEDDLYASLTKDLVHFAGKDPAKWGVRVAVSVVNHGLAAGWNHTKLNIRDDVVVFASSVETDHLEVGVELGGVAAKKASDWYDTIWKSDDDCVASDPGICDSDRKVLTGIIPGHYKQKSMNTLMLVRGLFSRFGVGWTVNYEADDALFAGLDSTEQSAFFLNPSLLAERLNYRSVDFIDHLAKQLGRGIDIKFVWGDKGGQAWKPTEWYEITKQIEERLSHLPRREAELAQCSFHVARYAPGNGMVRDQSHAKFYMLDHDGFYVGSQNMYPSGIRSSNDIFPELQEFGFYFDGASTHGTKFVDTAVEKVVKPAWDQSRRDQIPFDQFDCDDKKIPVHLSAFSPTHNLHCDSDFDLKLNFISPELKYDERAKVEGTTQCRAGVWLVFVTVGGAIKNDGRFLGTITGKVGAGQDSASLTGNYSKGNINLEFSDLEPVTGVRYEGIILNAD